MKGTKKVEKQAATVADLNNLFRLTKAHTRPATEILARAYQDDPGMIYYFPDEYERKKKLPYIFQNSIRRGVRHGEVYATSPNLEGVAVWLLSENTSMTMRRIIGNGDLSLLFKVRGKKALQLISFNHYLGSVRKRCAPFKHWYLIELVVDPIYQGKGYASILLKPMFTRIDKENLPCYLETQKEKNIPMYQHYGFEIVEENMVPGTKISTWAMLREIRGKVINPTVIEQ